MARRPAGWIEGWKPITAKWLRYVVSKDPFCNREMGELFAEFAQREGLSVGELDDLFREEERMYQRQLSRDRAARAGRTE